MPSLFYFDLQSTSAALLSILPLYPPCIISVVCVLKTEITHDDRHSETEGIAKEILSRVKLEEDLIYILVHTSFKPRIFQIVTMSLCIAYKRS